MQSRIECGGMRISRGNQVIGDWSSSEVTERIGNKDLLPTDSFYDEETSEWLPLSEIQTKVEPEKIVTRACYCGSGLPFQVCCGNGKKY